MPSGFRPWEDPSLPLEVRFEAYKGHVHQQIEALISAADKLGPLEFAEFERAPETRATLGHAQELAGMTAAEYRERVEIPRDTRKKLRTHFLGAEEWRSGFGVDVGPVPPIPPSITKELLKSPCPLIRDEKIKNSHVLVLIPQSVDGVPYTALKLHDLCATHNPTGHKLFSDAAYLEASRWKTQPWASAAVDSSRWVLMLEDDPETFERHKGKKHFKNKDIQTQQSVLDRYYPDYQPVKTLERITALLLHEVVRGEQLSVGTSRCEEQNSTGDGRVTVGYDFDERLWIDDSENGGPHDDVGMSVSRKL